MDSSYLSHIKKNAEKEKGVIIFGDEAAFRPEPTLFQTWARVGCQPKIPSIGQKQTKHVFGAVAIATGRFLYRFAEVCNETSFKLFLGTLLVAFYPLKIFMVIDNARYHKSPGIIFFRKQHQRRLELWFLPTYSPELNAIEPVWKYTRKESTHNRFFQDIPELISCIKTTFRDIQHHPEKIEGYLLPYI